MNAQRVSIGEMGGRGLGHWDGVPMAMLVRMVLEEADSLDRAIAVFRDHKRTCEYYFVIADGKTGKAVGMEASWDVFTTLDGREPRQVPAAIKDAVRPLGGRPLQGAGPPRAAGHGTFDAESARHLMDRPVAMKSNLHSVLFETTTTRFWVAHASKEGKPAAEQPYHAFRLSDLLEHRPILVVHPPPRRRPSPAGRPLTKTSGHETLSVKSAVGVPGPS